VVAGVATAARQRGLPCLVMAGRVDVDPREAADAGVTATWSLVDHVGDERRALERPADGLRGLAERAARQWSSASAADRH